MCWSVLRRCSTTALLNTDKNLIFQYSLLCMSQWECVPVRFFYVLNCIFATVEWALGARTPYEYATNSLGYWNSIYISFEISIYSKSAKKKHSTKLVQLYLESVFVNTNNTFDQSAGANHILNISGLQSRLRKISKTKIAHRRSIFN